MYIYEIVNRHNHPYDLIKICTHCNIQTVYFDSIFNLSCRCDCLIYGFGYDRKLKYFSRTVKDYNLTLMHHDEFYIRYNKKIISIDPDNYNLLPIYCSNDEFLKFMRNILLLQ